MTPGTLRRMSSTPQKQPPASTATSVCFPVATAVREVPSCSFMMDHRAQACANEAEQRRGGLLPAFLHEPGACVGECDRGDIRRDKLHLCCQPIPLFPVAADLQAWHA